MSRFFDRAAVAIEKRLLARAEIMRDEAKERIGVPVVRQGGKVIRSKPGEPPRRDKGKLQASASAQTINATSTVQASVSVSTPYAKRLNDQMNRPIFGPILSNNKKAILDAVRTAIVSDTKGQ
jgi:hypothetical protein